MQFDFFLVLALVTVMIHLAVIGLDFAGAAAVWTGKLELGRLPIWQRAYLVMTFLKSLSHLTFVACPLTALENCFRTWSSFQTPYDETFVGHYAPWVVIQVDLALTVFLMASGCVAVVNVVHHKLTQEPECLTRLKVGSTNEDVS